MKLIRGLHNLSGQIDGCVATIGNFDGVHRAHRVIIEQVQEHAARLDVPSVVMIFEPQPREYFEGDDSPPRLMRFFEKLEVLKNLQIDWVVCLQFNHRLRQLNGRQFITDILHEGLHVRYLVVGDDFRFGCDRSGNYDLLKEYGGNLGFEVEHTRTVAEDGRRISSSWVREMLEEGRVSEVDLLLGGPYSITGRVMHGQKIGRQLNAPTANIDLGRSKPALNGVFAVKVFIPHATDLKSMEWTGVANIGNRPTVNGITPVLEVHILGFSGDLYGRRLSVVFCHKIRDEIRFDSLDALRVQIHDDVNAGKTYFEQLGEFPS